MKKILFDGNKNVISEKTKQYRLEFGYTQGQLAAKMQALGVNIDQQMISKIESNTRFVTDYELACLCHIFDIQPYHMLKDFYDRYTK